MRSMTDEGRRDISAFSPSLADCLNGAELLG
jgi:hypothetical protein